MIKRENPLLVFRVIIIATTSTRISHDPETLYQLLPEADNGSYTQDPGRPSQPTHIPVQGLYTEGSSVTPGCTDSWGHWLW